MKKGFCPTGNNWEYIWNHLKEHNIIVMLSLLHLAICMDASILQLENLPFQTLYVSKWKVKQYKMANVQVVRRIQPFVIARRVTVSWFSKITWAAEQKISTLRVIMGSTAQCFYEYQLTATCLALNLYIFQAWECVFCIV